MLRDPEMAQPLVKKDDDRDDEGPFFNPRFMIHLSFNPLLSLRTDFIVLFRLYIDCSDLCLRCGVFGKFCVFSNGSCNVVLLVCGSGKFVIFFFFGK